MNSVSRFRFALLAAGCTALLASSAVAQSAAAPAAAPSPAATPAAPASVAAADSAIAPAPLPGFENVAPGEVSPEAAAAQYLPDRSVGDSSRAASDHDYVVGRWGISGANLRSAPFACGSSTTPATCTLDVAAVGVRRWLSRNVGYSLGLAFGVAGGSDREPGLSTWRSRGTSLQVGPAAGLSFLLGNWRHLAITASPHLAFVVFKQPDEAGGDGFLLDLRAQLEAELHLGFIGLPALSVGMTTGLRFQFSSVTDHRDWSLAAFHPGTISSVVENLVLRYYF